MGLSGVVNNALARTQTLYTSGWQVAKPDELLSPVIADAKVSFKVDLDSPELQAALKKAASSVHFEDQSYSKKPFKTLEAYRNH